MPSLFRSLSTLVVETPMGLGVLASGVLALAAVCVSLAAAVRRRNRLVGLRRQVQAGELVQSVSFGKWPELFAVLATLAVMVLAVLGVAHARGLVLQGLHPDAWAKISLLGVGLAMQLNALVVASAILLVVLPGVGAALALALCHRSQARGLRHALALKQRANATGSTGSLEAEAYSRYPGFPEGEGLVLALAMVGTVPVPLLLGILRFALRSAAAFARAASVDPANFDPRSRAALLLQGLDQAERHLETAIGGSAAGLVLMALVSFVVFFWFSSARPRHRVAPTLPATSRPSNRALVIVVGICLTLSALAWRVARPYRQENREPLPVERASEPLWVATAGLITADLRGPDRLERAPVLAIAPGRVELDGAQVEGPKSAQERLELMRRNHGIIHPDGGWSGELILLLGHDVPARRLIPYLRAVRRASYGRIQLAFARWRVPRRPLLGEVRIDESTAARLELVEASALPAGAHRLRVGPRAGLGCNEREPLALELGADTPVAEWARVVVAAREKRCRVLLVLPAHD